MRNSRRTPPSLCIGEKREAGFVVPHHSQLSSPVARQTTEKTTHARDPLPSIQLPGARRSVYKSLRLISTPILYICIYFETFILLPAETHDESGKQNNFCMIYNLLWEIPQLLCPMWRFLQVRHCRRCTDPRWGTSFRMCTSARCSLMCRQSVC